jgi:Cytochrome c554 and c-prime
MKRTVLAVMGMLLAAAVLTFAAPGVQAEPDYVGVDACAKCHKKDKEGRQAPIWEKTKHAMAYKNLGTPKAKEAAQKLGVSGDPQKAEACLVCHTTGYGEPDSRFDKKFDVTDGVQCEACHGPGGDYKKKSTMKKIREEYGPDHKGNSPTAKETGLIIPDEKTCKQCHAPERTFKGKTFKAPNYEPFDFKKMFDKIKHPIPS